MSKLMEVIKSPITCIFDLGENSLKSTSDDNDKMEIQGWASVKDIDLDGHIVLPTAFNKYFSEYEQKGRYWFNHNHEQVLGRVEKSRITEEGFYIDKAVLSATHFNKSFIFPLIKDGGLNEHSIQFWSLDSEYDKAEKILYHKEVRLIETSIVSVACNPGAIIENFKSYLPSVDFENCDLNTLIELDKKGLVTYPSEVRKMFYVENNVVSKKDLDTASEEEEPKEEKMNTTNLSPDFREFMPTQTKISKEDHASRASSKPVSFPKRHHKNYSETADALFLAKSQTKENSFLFRVGEMTEDGPRYNFNDTAISLGMLLGVKGGYLLDNDIKVELIEKVFDIYKVLEKDLPIYDEVSINELSGEVLSELSWKDLEFKNNENLILEEQLFESNLKGATDLLNKYSKTDSKPEFVTDLFEKYVGISSQIYFDVSKYSSEEDKTFMQSVMDMISSYLTNDDNEFSMSGLGKYLMASENSEAMSESVEQEEDTESKDLDSDSAEEKSENTEDSEEAEAKNSDLTDILLEILDEN